MGILKTINALVTSLESSKDILERLENIIAPGLADVLQNEFIGQSFQLPSNSVDFIPTELYDDIFDMIDALTFHRRAIGPRMWPIFELIHKTFKSDALDYFDSE